MPYERRDIERLLDDDSHDRVIELLTSEGPPAGDWQMALLARAYARRGDSRGDLFAASFFARRAADAGFNEPWLGTIIERYQRTSAEAQIRRLHYDMGGIDESREPAAAPYDFSALSVSSGPCSAPKDIDWSRRNVPCQAACPARTDIPAYLTAIYEQEYETAYRINLESNVFPGVLGRVCARPCENACRHGWEGLGEPVAICFSKRAAADLRSRRPMVLDKWFEPTGKRVAVVGAGVAGLTTARELARWGHSVTVYEKHAEPGGMLNQGIPEFRLPRDTIAREIEQISALGVDIRCGTAIGRDIMLDRLVASNDAVVLAAGTLRPNLLDLPGKDLDGVRHGLDFLLEANTTGRAQVGRRVVVIGGGFTAMDCARTAKRLGAAAMAPEGPSAPLSAAPDDHVKVWYRRTRQEMLITPGELEELAHESIEMEFLVSPVRYIGENGRVTAIEFIRTRLGDPDASGRRRPEPVKGSEFQVRADTVLLATGQFPDTEWITGPARNLLVDTQGWMKPRKGAATEAGKIFVAGDFAQGASSLINAIGHARQAAVEVDTFLMGATRLAERVAVDDARETGRIREMDAVPVQPMPARPVGDRTLAAEVEQGYDADLATDETQRCYRCHYKYEIDADKCIYCDWCVKAKPRPECILRVRKLLHDDEGRITGWEEASTSDEAYLVWINQEDCIRCGACVDACPVDAISLQKVSLGTCPAHGCHAHATGSKGNGEAE